jgi:hypothetical protein
MAGDGLRAAAVVDEEGLALVNGPDPSMEQGALYVTGLDILLEFRRRGLAMRSCGG